jgi:hypothetical protein
LSLAAWPVFLDVIKALLYYVHAQRAISPVNTDFQELRAVVHVARQQLTIPPNSLLDFPTLIFCVVGFVDGWVV